MVREAAAVFKFIYFFRKHDFLATSLDDTLARVWEQYLIKFHVLLPLFSIPYIEPFSLLFSHMWQHHDVGLDFDKRSTRG